MIDLTRKFAFNENKISKLYNSEILKQKKDNKKTEFIKSEYVTWIFYFLFFFLKFPSSGKLVMTSQINFIRFYDVITRNSVFDLGFVTREFQISPFLHLTEAATIGVL